MSGATPKPSARTAAAVVLYDKDCGFCRWSVGLLEGWDRRGRLRVEPIQGQLGRRLLAPVPVDDRLDSWHLVTADGRLYSAGAAFAPLFRLLPGAGLLAGLAARNTGPADRAYGWVSRHRSTLARLLRI